MFTHNRKVHAACIFNYHFENEGHIKVTSTYTVNVVIYWKQFEIDSQLQWETNSN